MPLYNELAVIDGVLDEPRRACLDLPAVAAGGAEVIVVDDRGTDGSADRVRARAMVDARIELLVNDVNVGHGRSVLAGLDHAHGEWLLQLDSDGQVDLAGFATLWAGRDDADLWYAERHDATSASAQLTRFVNAGERARRRIIDANAGYKLPRRSLSPPADGDPPTRPLAAAVIGGLRGRGLPVHGRPRDACRPVVARPAPSRCGSGDAGSSVTPPSSSGAGDPATNAASSRPSPCRHLPRRERCRATGGSATGGSATGGGRAGGDWRGRDGDAAV